MGLEYLVAVLDNKKKSLKLTLLLLIQSYTSLSITFNWSLIFASRSHFDKSYRVPMPLRPPLK